jgi:2-haloacid dehalogenase
MLNPSALPEACVFDAYGTLFDYASAAPRCSAALGDNGEQLTKHWREKQLTYTWLRSLQGRHADFWQVTRDALDFALEASERAPRPERWILATC